ncbi:hypothetical protein Hanom_Chr04g00317771 [Helianthus anomalus]
MCRGSGVSSETLKFLNSRQEHLKNTVYCIFCRFDENIVYMIFDDDNLII